MTPILPTSTAPRTVQRTTIGVTGASGLIGRVLCALAERDGHTVVRFGRGSAKADAHWSPHEGRVDLEALGRCSAVVHLAGAGIADHRWTDAYKREILESRTVGTRVISEALAGLGGRRSLVSASAVGYYGDCGAQWVDERSGRGAGFLADVCAAWEAAAQPARAAGLRVVHPRIGVVLSTQGGALAKMLPVFRLGVGGAIGSGAQYMSWIAIEDAARALLVAALDGGAVGAINVVTNEPVTNAQFSAVLGRVLRRPAALPVPGFAIRAAFGELGREALLGSQRVRPVRLGELGFEYAAPVLEVALKRLLEPRP